METMDLQKTFDLKFLEKFLRAFADATGMAVMAFDMETNITTPHNFTDFCMKYTRGSKEGLRRCQECDLKSGEESSLTGRPYVYHCHLGIVDFAVPIVVDGTRVGSVLGGQVLTSPPDENKFREYALELGIDPDAYIKALRKVRIVPEKQIRAAAEFLYLAVGKVSENWSHIYKINSYAKMITDNIKMITVNLKSFTDFIMSLEKMQQAELSKTQNTLEEINKITKLVASIASQSNMLALNASIEAARAGKSGKTFAVIANEMGVLSISTKKTVDGILDFTAVLSSIVGTSGTKDSTNSKTFLKTGLEELKKINDELQGIQGLLNELQTLVK